MNFQSITELLGKDANTYAHNIPFIVKINHNELLTFPTKYNQIMFGSVREAWNLGATAIGATIYFGSEESDRQILEVAGAFEEAHSLWMPTILRCYTRNNAFKKNGVNYETTADITGQANHIGVTIQADIIKQKMPNINGGFIEINFSKSDLLMYSQLATNHPIDLWRYQVANCYMGRIGLINSGGESKGASDLVDAVKNAVINKRAGGMGMIMGRKAFQRPFIEGVDLLHSVQEVYLSNEINLA
jgi:class I fructose-bisphosphate aldolase